MNVLSAALTQEHIRSTSAPTAGLICEVRAMHEDLVNRLRIAAQLADKGLVITPSIYLEAADAIEELLDFAHFVASEVVVTDEEWDNNVLVFPEAASRKLNKLCIVEKDGAYRSYEPPKEE